MTGDQSGWDVPVAYANELFLDRELVDHDDVSVGKVDDLQFDLPADGGPPVLTAILCGPTALGARLGGRLGTWWVAIARRLRPRDDVAPVIVDIDDVDRITRETVQLRTAGSNVGTWRLRHWVDAKIIERIPGGH
jgi:hypothetical protein